MADPANSKIQIINKSLARIKQRTIASLDEQSEQARKAGMFYDCVRTSLLRQCGWRWARVKKPLNLLGDQATAIANPTDQSKQDVIPQWNFLYAYPAHCIRLFSVFNNVVPVIPDPFQDRYISMGKRPKFEIIRSPITNVQAIACQLESAYAEFTYDIEDPSQFDSLFIDAFETQLALELAIPLTCDKEMVALLKQEAQGNIEEAMRHNGDEGTDEMPHESPYESAREGSSLGLDSGNHAL